MVHKDYLVALEKDDHEKITLRYLLLKLQDLFRFLFLKWKTILLLCVLGGIAGFTIAYLQKPKYIAITTFVLEENDKGGGLGQYAGLATLAGVDIGGGSNGIFQGENIVQLYKSRLMIQKTLLSAVEGKNMLLVDEYIAFKGLRKSWSEKPELRDLSFNKLPFSRIQDSVFNKIVEDISANYLSISKPDKKLSLIEVDVNSENETFSKDFNDQIVKTVNTFYIQTKTKKALKDLSVLQHQADSVRSVLNKSVVNVASINDATPNLNPARQTLRSSGQLSQLNAEANKAILVQIVPSLELSKIALRKETPLIQVIDTPIYPLKKITLSKSFGIVAGVIIMFFLTSIFLVLKKVSNL